jgi:hypothetical protein
MESFLSIFAFLYLVAFFGSVVYGIMFDFKREGSDERGARINGVAYSLAFHLVILGWFLLWMIDSYIRPFSYEEYKLAIWFVITAPMIIRICAILILKKV